MNDDSSLLQAALVGYQQRRDQIDEKIAQIRSQIGGQTSSAPAKRVMSPAARKRIAAAQRKRWKALKTAKRTAAPKRKLSAAGRKRIIEATKKRWAEFRAKKAAATA